MKFNLPFLILSLVLPRSAFALMPATSPIAQPSAPASPVVSGTLNQVLFSDSEQTFTLRDLQLYQKVLSSAYNRKKLNDWSANSGEDFILSRLSFREAQLFGVSPENIKLSEADRAHLAKYSSKEIDAELNLLRYAVMFTELKDNQLKQKERFRPWFDHLKRKYQVSYKTTEIIQ